MVLVLVSRRKHVSWYRIGKTVRIKDDLKSHRVWTPEGGEEDEGMTTAQGIQGTHWNKGECIVSVYLFCMPSPRAKGQVLRFRSFVLSRRFG